MARPGGGAVYLVDASPYIFRAHFSLPSSIRTPEGTPIAATHGFTSFLLGLIEGSPESEPATHLGVAFDRHLNSSFRNEIYPAYKAQRDLPPPEIEAQIDTCFEVAKALGAAVFIDERYEADDLIATIAKRIEGEGRRVVVVTSDKDLAQLVDARTTLYDLARDTRYTPVEVLEKFGVRPEQIVDYLALAGDAVDNIPGVHGIGAKSASALLAHFGSLAALYDRLEEVPSLPIRGAKSLRDKLDQGRDSAFLSRSLSEVHREVPGVKVTLADLALRPPRWPELEPLFARLGFRSHLERARKLPAPR